MFKKIKQKILKKGFSKKSKSDIIIYIKNRKRLISQNIFKYKNDISDLLLSYNKKHKINNALYQEYKQNYENFEKINSKIRQQHKPKEEKLISDLINDYYIKKKMNLTEDDIKSNIFEISPLIEPSLSKLKMEYLLNYNDYKKEIEKKEDKLYLTGKNIDTKYKKSIKNIFKPDNLNKRCKIYEKNKYYIESKNVRE